jgi:hypothetical protein
MAQNLVQLNKVLRKNGMPKQIELVKGKGYFYFATTADADENFIGPESWPNGTSVMVFRMNQLSEAQWLDQYKSLSGDDCLETKKNLLSGKTFTQAKGTPLCCDPSSETYWSM